MAEAKQESKRLSVARTQTTEANIDTTNVESLGASYSHIKNLSGIIGPNTKRVVAYHALITSLAGFEATNGVDTVYLGFNRIKEFRAVDATIKKIGVLDLVGNPISSLKYCPPCDTLIVSSTLIPNLLDCPNGVRIIRCGHSTHLKSLKGCPPSVKIIECSCAPNLQIDDNDLPKGLEELIKG